MRAIINTYDGSVPIVEYFINPSVIQTINTGTNYSIQVLIMQPLLDGSIVNPPTVLSCPGMNYFLLNSKNSANFSLDPYEQSVFSQEFSLNGSVPYLGQSGSVLCSLGNCKYGASDIKTLSTDNLSVFANALYLGQRVINNQNYYCVALLPESQFNPHQTIPVTSLNVYSTFTSIIYIMSSITSGSQFTSATSISSKSTTSSYSITPGLGVSKITITVSNIPLITNTPGN